MRGQTLGIDGTTLEASAALRSIVRRDTGESYQDFLTQLARASRIATPTHAESGSRTAGSRRNVVADARRVDVGRDNQLDCAHEAELRQRRDPIVQTDYGSNPP